MSDAVAGMYAVLDGRGSSACEGCGQCCASPWLLPSEAPPGVPVRDEAGVRFVDTCGACPALRDGRCGVYAQRPLDCRLYPLDLVRHDGAYVWCIYTDCRDPDALEAVLAPAIPQLEAAMTLEVFEAFQRQIEVTRRTYPSYREGRYRVVRAYGGPGAT